MSQAGWLAVHLAATAVLTGIGLVVQVLVYPGFARVPPDGWASHHDAHVRAITWVVGLPWVVQGISTVALIVAPPPGQLLVVLVLAVLAAVPVAVTLLVAVPAHGRLGRPDHGRERELTVLLRANLARTSAWTAATVLAVALLG